MNVDRGAVNLKKIILILGMVVALGGAFIGGISYG